MFIWPDTDGPATFDTTSAGKTLATEFYVTSGTWWLSHIWIWRGSWDMSGPFYARLYQVNSPSSGTPIPGTDVKIKPKGLGWLSAPVPIPFQLTVGQTYRVVYWTPFGATSSPNYW